MPESGVTKHNYLFCQFVNPARGHKGDRCDCFDTPSQRRTTLAKQRLARLRANRSINRASTSNDPESAVASDPAVTGFVTAGSEATADSGSLEVEARLISRLARSRASLCLARVVLRWLGVSKQSQRSPSCPRAGLTNWQKR